MDVRLLKASFIRTVSKFDVCMLLQSNRVYFMRNKYHQYYDTDSGEVPFLYTLAEHGQYSEDAIAPNATRL